ncbi:MAG: GNAT family N-acetyltransferase [Pseudomonadota bacterium]
MSFEVHIRKARRSEADDLGEVFFKAVREGPSPYTEAQRAAWAPAPRTGADWADRVFAGEVMTAEAGDGSLAGFVTMDATGYSDFAYILPEARGRGLFRRLYTPLEADALAAGARRFSTHASLMARPAYEAVGFSVVRDETVEVNGERLDRFDMEKLTGA